MIIVIVIYRRFRSHDLHIFPCISHSNSRFYNHARRRYRSLKWKYKHIKCFLCAHEYNARAPYTLPNDVPQTRTFTQVLCSVQYMQRVPTVKTILLMYILYK